MARKQTFKGLKKLKKQLHRHFKLTFIPHKANQYRPHLIRRYGLVAVLVAGVGLQAGYNVTTTGTVLGEKTDLSVNSLLVDTNAERANNQLPPLVVDEKLSQAASLKAQDMFKQQYWAHMAPDGTTPWQWFAQAGYSYDYAGENLAKNFQTAEGATTAWMASAEHRANILDDKYTNVGFAVADGVLSGKPTKIVVALYGTPASAGVAGAKTVQLAPVAQNISLLTRFGVALQSLTPAALGSLMLVLVAMFVAVSAHTYRRRLPKALRESWYHHHGAYKAAGLATFAVMIVTLYSGGQI